MHPILFKLGTFSVYSYGFMIAIAFVAGLLVSAWLARKEGIAQDQVLDVALYTLLASIVGARVFYVIEFFRDYVNNPLSVLFIWQGGLVFYGGLVFAVLAIIITAKFFKIPSLKLFDVAAPATAIGYAIGRIGCFFNGCCYGAESNLSWAVKFPNLYGLRHPTQIYAALAGFLIFGSLILLWKYKKFDGQVFSIGLALYSIYRFLIEFVRTNPKYISGLSEAQIASIVIFILSIILYWRLSRKK